MIRIDKTFLGQSAIHLWREVLKKKSTPLIPLSGNYLILPYLYLDKNIRGIIIRKETMAGTAVWESIKTKINGKEENITICKKWGAIIVGYNKMWVLDDYPIQELNEISFDLPDVSSNL